MRLSAAAALFSALLLSLLFSAAAAYADPTLILNRSEARAGEKVQFSISDIEDRATYDVEVGDKDVAEGRDAAGTGVSGEFTMPDFGAAARTVTVKAEVNESGETEVLTQTLRYLPPSRAVSGPAESLPAVAQSPSSTQAPAPSPASRAPARKRRPSGRPAEKRRARRSPGRAHGPRPRERPRTTGAGHRSRGRASPGSKPTIEVIAPRVTLRSTGKRKPPSTGEPNVRAPSEPRGVFGRGLTTPLTTSLATFSPPSGVADSDAGSIVAVVVLTLLGLAALAIAVAQQRRRWRLVGAEDWRAHHEDDEILQGNIHVPGSGAASDHPR